MTITQANSRATVHRPQYLDYVGLRVFNAQGVVVGERRFLGLFTSTAYTQSVMTIPVIKDRVEQIIERSGFLAESHSEKDLLQVLESFPRDELFQTGRKELHKTVDAVMRLQERRLPGVLRRIDEFGRFVSVLVYLPRDRYNTAVRLAIEKVLQTTYEAKSVDFTANVGDSTLARLHFVVRPDKGGQVADVPLAQLEKRILDSAQTWGERLGAASRGEDGPDASARVMSKYAKAFPAAYMEDFSARQAVADLRHIESLADEDDTNLTLYKDVNSASGERRFKLFRRRRLVLTDIIPVFTGLGVDVIDERPYTMERADGVPVHIYDFGLAASQESVWGAGEQESGQVREKFQDAFLAVTEGRAQSDGLGALVLGAGLNWHQVAVLRGVVKYLQQIQFGRSQRFVEQTLTSNVELTRGLVRLFEVRFDPALPGADRDAEQDKVIDSIEQGLADVTSLDEEKVLRTVMAVMLATLRTNAFTRKKDGSRPDVLSLKLEPREIPGMPSPKPRFEIWVYSPRVEGVHLRFGPIARGGLRWSDRREDFRTEVLGLVKAQMVKNAVIVPTGSKGGFFAKNLPDSSDREAWLAEGIACYKRFISGMLDLTDNLVDGVVVPPTNVVRHDGDDSYLVVAADKGTATFSDIANGVAQDYGFWLDDAFASGGSAGYDHKAMGITARGAWESVKRHFREMGIDTQQEPFTVTGVGDMSGDVFGNGMLCSQHIRLVAAFDHRHIFLDPNPDEAASYVERKRLFELPRSSWADYDTSFMSAGGGVYPRSAKSIPIGAEVRAALGLDDDVQKLAPSELMEAILRAPVDLFWNGGIG
ncbi:MAG: NAD-glutamate dehydrogenase domain-containing protein, partial [Rhodococcus sp. (in: high G+C Gram-positive bacteria)]